MEQDFIESVTKLDWDYNICEHAFFPKTKG